MGVALSAALTRMRADFKSPVEVLNASYIDKSAIALDRPDGSVWAVTNFRAHPPVPSVDSCMATIISDRMVERLGYRSDSVTTDIELLSNVTLRNLRIEYYGVKPSEADIESAVEKMKQDTIDNQLLPTLQIAMKNPGAVLQSIIAESIMSGEYFIDVLGIFNLGSGHSNPAQAKLTLADKSVVTMEKAFQRTETPEQRTKLLLYVSAIMLNYMETFMFETDETRQRSLDAMGVHTRNAFFEMLCAANLIADGHMVRRDDILMPGFTKKYTVGAFREGRAKLRTFFGSGSIFYPVITSLEDHDKRIHRQSMGVLSETPSEATFVLYMKALDMLIEVSTMDVSASIEVMLEGCKSAARSMFSDHSESHTIQVLMEMSRQANLIRALAFLDRRYPGIHDNLIRMTALETYNDISSQLGRSPAPSDIRPVISLLWSLDMLISITSADVSADIKNVENYCVKAMRSWMKKRRERRFAAITDNMVYSNLISLGDANKIFLSARHFRKKI